MKKPKPLILCFSKAGENYVQGEIIELSEGSCKKGARIIAKATGADLFEIEPEEPYPDNYEACVQRAKEELQKKARPKLKKTLQNEDLISTVISF